MPDRYDDQLLLDYVEGDMSEEDRKAFEREVRADDSLRQLLDGIMGDRKQLRDMPVEQAPEDLMERVNLSLEREALLAESPEDDEATYDAPPPVFSFSRFVAYSGVAAMILLCGTLVFQAFQDAGRIQKMVDETADAKDGKPSNTLALARPQKKVDLGVGDNPADDSAGEAIGGGGGGGFKGNTGKQAGSELQPFGPSVPPAVVPETQQGNVAERIALKENRAAGKALGLEEKSPPKPKVAEVLDLARVGGKNATPEESNLAFKQSKAKEQLAAAVQNDRLELGQDDQFALLTRQPNADYLPASRRLAEFATENKSVDLESRDVVGDKPATAEELRNAEKKIDRAKTPTVADIYRIRRSATGDDAETERSESSEEAIATDPLRLEVVSTKLGDSEKELLAWAQGNQITVAMAQVDGKYSNVDRNKSIPQIPNPLPDAISDADDGDALEIASEGANKKSVHQKVAPSAPVEPASNKGGAKADTAADEDSAKDPVAAAPAPTIDPKLAKGDPKPKPETGKPAATATKRGGEGADPFFGDSSNGRPLGLAKELKDAKAHESNVRLREYTIRVRADQIPQLVAHLNRRGAQHAELRGAQQLLVESESQNRHEAVAADAKQDRKKEEELHRLQTRAKRKSTSSRTRAIEQKMKSKREADKAVDARENAASSDSYGLDNVDWGIILNEQLPLTQKPLINFANADIILSITIREIDEPAPAAKVTATKARANPADAKTDVKAKKN